MAVRVGSARIDENGKAHGGKAGDQTGKEVSTQSWYLHSKGWRVFRAKTAQEAEKIAACMDAACTNNNVGYDQYQRHTLYKAAKPLDFNVAKVTTKCETDCSALVRVCCAFAGITGIPESFRTGNMPSNLMKTGHFVELTGSKYQEKSEYLGRGDILVTKTNGHTVVVLSNGSRYEGPIGIETYELGDRTLRNGDSGPDVKLMQEVLIKLGYDLGKWGVDGEFGDCTELAVVQFQRDHGINPSGVFDSVTFIALEKAATAAAEPHVGKHVKIVNGNCYIRSQPDTSGIKYDIAYRDEVFEYTGETSEAGWNGILFEGKKAWVSGKYSIVID